MTTFVNCPICGNKLEWSPKSKFRPFCSERCKQMDLGAWAAEKYTIAGKPGEDVSGEPESKDLN